MVIAFIVLIILMSAVLYWAVGIALVEAIKHHDWKTIISWILCILFLTAFDYIILSTVWKYWF